MHPSINLLLVLVIVVLTASATVLITRSLGVGRKVVQENRHLTLLGGMFDKLVALLSVILVVMIIVLAFPGFVTSPNANLFIFSIVVCPATVFLYTLLLIVLPRIKWVENKLYETT